MYRQSGGEYGINNENYCKGKEVKNRYKKNKSEDERKIENYGKQNYGKNIEIRDGKNCIHCKKKCNEHNV